VGESHFLNRAETIVVKHAGAFAANDGLPREPAVTMAIRHLAKRLETDKTLARKVKTRGGNVVC
jgi:hypothetical protein